jgi:hypothetical protein
MANNTRFKFIWQRSTKTAPQPQPPDMPQSLHASVRILMRDGKWLVEPGERPERRDDGPADRPSSE